MRTKLNLKVVDGETKKQSFIRISEVRNLIVHKRGVIDSHFKERQPQSKVNIGDLIEIEDLEAIEDIQALCNSVESLDDIVSKKYGIEQPESGENFSIKNRLEFLVLVSGIYFVRLSDKIYFA